MFITPNVSGSVFLEINKHLGLFYNQQQLSSATASRAMVVVQIANLETTKLSNTII